MNNTMNQASASATHLRVDVGEEADHLKRDVLRVEARAVEGGVGDLRCDQAAFGALRRGARNRRSGGAAALEDQRDGACAEDHTVTPRVERHRGELGTRGRRCRAKRGESAADERQQRRARRVVRRDDDDAVDARAAVSPARAVQPVLRHGDRLGRPRTRGVELDARTARSDELRDLRRTGDEHLEEKLAVEGGRLRRVDGRFYPRVRRCAHDTGALAERLVQLPLALARDELE